MNDGGLEHRTGLLAALLALAGAGVAVMVGFAATTTLVWPIIAGGAATVGGVYLALAVLYRWWPFRDRFGAKLQALLAEGTALRGPEQKPPSGPPVGDAAAVQAWYSKVEEALAGRPELDKFNWTQGMMFSPDSGEVGRYRELATKIKNLKQIIDELNKPRPPPIVFPPPTVIEPKGTDPTLPNN